MTPEKELVKSWYGLGPRALRPRPEASGPLYLFENNNKNFTFVLFLLCAGFAGRARRRGPRFGPPPFC